MPAAGRTLPVVVVVVVAVAAQGRELGAPPMPAVVRARPGVSARGACAALSAGVAVPTPAGAAARAAGTPATAVVSRMRTLVSASACRRRIWLWFIGLLS